MNKRAYWIIEIDPENFRVFTKGKNVMHSVELLNLLGEGKTLSEIWNPVFLYLYQGDEQEEGDVEREKSKPIPDFARGMLGISVSEQAHIVIKHLIENGVAFLPLDTEIGRYYELEIKQLNFVDNSKSAIESIPSGKLVKVKKYFIDYKEIENAHLFCSTLEGAHPIFASNEFKRIVEKNKLTGLTFHPIPLMG